MTTYLLKCRSSMFIALLHLLQYAVLPVYSDPGSDLPNGHVWGCLPGNVSSHRKFCNTSLPIEARLDDLVAALTLDEKIGLMSADSRTHVSSCNMMDAGCLRLGIPK
eukprot:UC1_evm1s685